MYTVKITFSSLICCQMCESIRFTVEDETWGVMSVWTPLNQQQHLSLALKQKLSARGKSMSMIHFFRRSSFFSVKSLTSPYTLFLTAKTSGWQVSLAFKTILKSHFIPLNRKMKVYEICQNRLQSTITSQLSALHESESSVFIFFSSVTWRNHHVDGSCVCLTLHETRV